MQRRWLHELPPANRNTGQQGGTLHKAPSREAMLAASRLIQAVFRHAVLPCWFPRLIECPSFRYFSPARQDVSAKIDCEPVIRLHEVAVCQWPEFKFQFS